MGLRIPSEMLSCQYVFRAVSTLRMMHPDDPINQKNKDHIVLEQGMKTLFDGNRYDWDAFVDIVEIFDFFLFMG